MTTIITIEFQEIDAFRLLFLVQRESTTGRIWDAYWEGLAQHIRENIKDDLQLWSQICYQEELAGLRHWGSQDAAAAGNAAPNHRLETCS